MVKKKLRKTPERGTNRFSPLCCRDQRCGGPRLLPGRLQRRLHNSKILLFLINPSCTHHRSPFSVCIQLNLVCYRMAKWFWGDQEATSGKVCPPRSQAESFKKEFPLMSGRLALRPQVRSSLQPRRTSSGPTIQATSCSLWKTRSRPSRSRLLMTTATRVRRTHPAPRG